MKLELKIDIPRRTILFITLFLSAILIASATSFSSNQLLINQSTGLLFGNTSINQTTIVTDFLHGNGSNITSVNADTVDGYHLNQGVRTTDSPTFEGVTTGNLSGDGGNINASGANITNASNLQAPASSIAGLCSWDSTKVCIVNGTTRNLDYVGNNQTVIESALASNKNIYIAEGVTYVPTSDTIPAYARITCSGNTSIIQPGNPTTTVLRMGAYSSIVNCGIKTANQAGMENSGTVSGDLRMAYYILNNRNQTYTPSWWPGKAFAVVTGFPGVDAPGISSLIHGPGDALWAGVNDTGIGLRIEVNSDYPAQAGYGAYILNKGAGNGIWAKSVIGSSGDLARLVVDEDVIGLKIDHINNSVPAHTQNFVSLTSSNKTAGNYLNLYQSGSAFTGNGIEMNFGTDGDFTGNFIKASVAGQLNFTVTDKGNITMPHSVQNPSCIQMTSPDGTAYTLQIANGGNTSVTAGTCS